MFIGAKWSGERTRLSEFKRLRGPPGVKLMWIASYLSVLLCAWIQFASATGGLITKNTWWGVLIPRHFLGRLLSLIMTGLISFWLMVVKSLLFGWYWPMSPLLFSFQPGSHQASGWAKWKLALNWWAIFLWSANSVPWSKVRVRTGSGIGDQSFMIALERHWAVLPSVNKTMDGCCPWPMMVSSSQSPIQERQINYRRPLTNASISWPGRL